MSKFQERLKAAMDETEELDELRAMHLHETKSIQVQHGSRTVIYYITKVPSGWLYSNANCLNLQPVFVPSI